MANNATKSTPAPAKKTVAKKTTPPALNFSALTVQDAAPPVRRTGVSGTDNPFLPYIRQSWAGRTPMAGGTFRGKGKQVSVPAANGTQVANLIRSAAAYLSSETGERIGAATQIDDDPDTKGNVLVKFCAKSAKKSTKKTAAPAAPTAPEKTA